MSSGLGKGARVGIRSEYAEKQFGDVTGTTLLTATRLIKLSQMAKVFYLDNSTNRQIKIAVVTAEDTTFTKVDWLTIQPGRIINFELASNNLTLEAGTEVWIYAPVAPASGNLSMFTWG